MDKRSVVPVHKTYKQNKESVITQTLHKQLQLGRSMGITQLSPPKRTLPERYQTAVFDEFKSFPDGSGTPHRLHNIHQRRCITRNLSASTLSASSDGTTYRHSNACYNHNMRNGIIMQAGVPSRTYENDMVLLS